MTVVIVILTLLLFLAFGMPVAFALGISGALGIYLTIGFEGMLGQLSAAPYRSIASLTLSTIPLFILMAEVVNQGGIARDLFNVAIKWMGRLPGGLAIATVLANAGFATVCGSTTAAAGTMASISIPEFKRLGYGMSTATGVNAVAGVLGVLIPPSLPLIMYGIMTENSIGKLLIAGIVPGLLTTLIFIIGILLWAHFDPKNLPRGEKYSAREKIGSLKDVWAIIIIVLFIVIALYSGMASTTEIAAFGAMLSFIYLVFTRRINISKTIIALKRTVRTSVMILSIMVGAMLFGYYLTISQAPQSLIRIVENSELSPWGILSLILLVYLVLGCLMDGFSILIITLPITYPLIHSLGFDPIWFGIIVAKMIEFGLITPPVGMNVYVVSGVTGVPLEQVFRGTGYMLLLEGITILLLLFIPELSTWLPGLMKQ